MEWDFHRRLGKFLMQFWEVPRLRCGAARVALRQLLEVHLRRPANLSRALRDAWERSRKSEDFFCEKIGRLLVATEKNQIKSGYLRMKEPRLPRDTCFVCVFSSGASHEVGNKVTVATLELQMFNQEIVGRHLKIPRSRLS